MAITSVTTIGTTAQKKDTSVLCFQYSEEFLTAAGLECEGLYMFLICHLPENSVLVEALVITDIACNDATSIGVRLGTTTTNADIMNNINIIDVGVHGSLNNRIRTGDSLPVYLRVLVTGDGIVTPPKFTVVLKYIEYEINTSEYTAYD